VNDPLVVPELARFNIEINSRPQVLVSSALRQLQQELQNGATWQRRYVARHGKDMQQLTCAYWERQRQGQPVHTWDLD
jgi:hypothetical protein